MGGRRKAAAEPARPSGRCPSDSPDSRAPRHARPRSPWPTVSATTIRRPARRTARQASHLAENIGANPHSAKGSSR